MTQDLTEVCDGGSATLQAFVTGGTGATVYQWQYNDSLTGWTDIFGATASTFVTPNLPVDTHQYRVTVSQGEGCFVLSEIIDIIVVDDPIVDIISGDQAVCVGGTANLEVSVTGGVGSPEYQWQFQDPFLGWFDIAGATSSTLVTPSLPAGAYNYRVRVSQVSGCETYSDPIVVTVVQDPSVSAFAADPEICEGGEAFITTNVTGGTGTTSYQWQFFFTGVGWVDVLGANDPTLSATPTGTGTFLYRVRITQASGCEATSNTVTILVVPGPSVSIQVDDDEICDEGSATLTANVSGGSGIDDYQWQLFDLANGWQDIAGATNASYLTNPLTPPGTYQYRVQVFQDAGCVATSSPVTIIVVPDPVVDVQIQDTTLCEGGQAMFNAVVTGGTGDTDYQWEVYADGFGWLNVQGATSASFTTLPLGLGTHQYRVIIEQDEGCVVASDTATITVVEDPTVTISATDIDICDQGAATLNAVVTGGFGDVTYQWQLNNPTFGWLDIFGADEATYVTPDLDIGTHEYRVLIEQNDGCDATSNSVFITVVDDPTVSITASDTEICAGGTVTVSTALVGGIGTTTYQWQRFVAGGWVDIDGADSASYTTLPLASGVYEYRIVVMQDEGCTATSGPVEITVYDDPIVDISAVNDEVCVGGVIQLNSTVTGGVGTTTYQWQFNGASGWQNVVGATSASYSLPAIAVDTLQYRLSISQNEGCDVTSDVIDIYILPDPVITASADDTVICQDASAVLDAMITGGSGTATYQWQRNELGVGWVDIPGATTQMYITGPLATGTHSYRVRVTQGEGCNGISNSVVITVIDQPDANLTIGSPVICSGGNTTIYTAVTGGNDNTTYQWQDSVPGGSWTNIFGQTGDTLMTPTLTTGTFYYRVNITQDGGCFGSSEVAVVTVVDDPDVDIEADDDVICDGGSSVLTSTVTGGAGASNYQWQEFDDLFGWVNIDGEIASTYNTPVLTIGEYSYRLVVTQAPGCYSVSDTVVITVLDDPNLLLSIDDPEFCEDGTATLSVLVSGGDGTVSYQWQESLSGTWTDISGATASSYTTPNLFEGVYNYRVIVSQDSGCETISDSVTVNVLADPTVTVSALDAQICDQGVALLLSNVTGGTGANSYQWQYDTGADNWEDIPGATDSTWLTGFLDVGNHRFRLIVTQDIGCETISGPVVIEVIDDPEVTISATDEEICGGGTVTLTALVSGGSGTATFQWQDFNIVDGWQNIGGATSGNFTTPVLTEGNYDYRVIVTQDASCSSISDSIRITVTAGPQVIAMTPDTALCTGATATITSFIAGGAGSATYQWQELNPVLGWVDIPGAVADTLMTASLTPGTYQYRVLIEQASGCAGTSNTVILNVFDDPVVGLAALEDEICEGGTAVLNATVSGGTGTATYEWQYDDQFTGWTTISGATSSTYSAPTLPVGTTTFRVIVTQAPGCEAMSDPVTITVVPGPTVVLTTDQLQICEGGYAVITSLVSGGVIGETMYQWQYNDPISGWIDMVGDTLESVATDTLAVGSYQYRVVVTQASGCQVVSGLITVVVNDAPVVGITASDTLICEGGVALITSTVIGGSGLTDYQWQVFDAVVGWSDITGANNPTFTTPVLTSGTRRYRVLISQNFGCDVTSDEVLITIVDDPQVLVSVSNETICEGGNSTLTAQVTGGTGTTSYQWQQYISGTGWQNISGSTDSTYSTTFLTEGTYSYRVQISQAEGCDAVSDSVAVEVVEDPDVTVDISDPEVCTGGVVVLTANVTGGTGTSIYQWSRFVAGTGWETIPGATSAQYNTGALAEGTWLYRIQVTQASGCSVTSGTVTVVALPDPIVSITADQSEVCQGGIVDLSAVVTGGSGDATYQWQYSFSGGPWTNLSNSDTSDYTSGPLLLGDNLFRVLVTQDAGCSALSNVVTVTAVPGPIVAVSVDDSVFCDGGSAVITSVVTGGTGINSFQWQEFGGSSWGDIPGATDSIYNTPVLTEGGYIYRVVVSQNSGCVVVSDSVDINVLPDPEVIVSVGDTTFCAGGSTLLSAQVTGGDGATIYQWQFESAPGVWTDIAGADEATYMTDTLSVGRLWIQGTNSPG